MGRSVGGMRLPWTPGPRYEALRPAGWHLLHIGPVSAAATWAASQKLPATEIAPAAHETPGTVYLVRPDGYIGLVAAAFSEAGIHGVCPALGAGEASCGQNIRLSHAP